MRSSSKSTLIITVSLPSVWAVYSDFLSWTLVWWLAEPKMVIHHLGNIQVSQRPRCMAFVRNCTVQCKSTLQWNQPSAVFQIVVHSAGNLEGTHSTVVSSPGLCFTTQHLDSSHTDKSIQSTSFEGPPRFPECENDDDGDEKQCTRPMMMGMLVLYCCFGLERQWIRRLKRALLVQHKVNIITIITVMMRIMMIINAMIRIRMIWR